MVNDSKLLKSNQAPRAWTTKGGGQENFNTLWAESIDLVSISDINLDFVIATYVSS